MSGRTPHHLVAVREDALLRQRLARQLGETILAAGDLHQLGHPADAGDDRLVPFLEIHPGPTRQLRRRRADRREVPLRALREGFGLGMRADHRAEAADVGEDAVHAAVVADPHLDAGLHQLARDVGLDVGETDRQVRLQLEDLADLRAGEGGTLGFSRRARGGRTVKPEMPTMRCSSPSA
jgi:hypothetical protein